MICGCITIAYQSAITRFYNLPHGVQTNECCSRTTPLEFKTTDLTKEHILGASAATYTQNSDTNKTNNRLLSDVSTGQQGVNLLKNCRLDNASVGINVAASWTPDGTGARLDTAGHYAENSLMLTRSAYTSTKDTWYQSVESLIPPGEYTFSAYIKVPSTTTFGTDGGVYLEIYSLSGGQYLPTSKSEVINYSTESFCDGWVRICLTFAAPQSGTVRVALSGANYKGLILADDFQLENEKSAATFNLMVNASFEESNTLNSSNSCGLWYKTGNATISTTTPTYFGDNSACLSGTGQQRANQNITLNLPLATTFILSGWAKATALPRSKTSISATTDPYFGLIIRLYYSDNTSEVHWYPFDPYCTDWQYVQGILVPEKTGNVTITEAAIVAAYDNNINTAYMDNITLRIERSQVYTYDEDGKPITATQSGTGMQSAEYYNNSVNLEYFTAENGAKTRYTYNDQHDVVTASLGGATCTNDYNTSGNLTGSMMTATGETKYIKSSTEPTSDRNHTATATNVNGNTVSYTYDNYLEQITSITDAHNQIFNYSYNQNNGRVTKIEHYDSSAFDQNKIAEIEYSYDDGNLTQLTRKTKSISGSWQYQNYFIEHNDWGQQTKLKVGNWTLSTNTYDSYGGRLTQTKLGTYQTVSYEYDDFDRLIRKEYNTGKYIEYTYNAEGALSKITYGMGTTPKGSYEFEYDSLGRLIRSAEYDGNGTLIQRTGHNYDAFSRLSSQSWVLGTKTYSETYTYRDGANQDGKLSTATTATDNKTFMRAYDYDLLKRLHCVDVKEYGTTILSNVYGYRTISGDRSSTQVEYHNVVRGSSYPVKNKYDYDACGNITAIYEDANANGVYRRVAEYSYDEQKQLVEEKQYTYEDSDATSGAIKTITYIYDTAGNIMVERENGVTTKQYYYEDANGWGDLLTGFDNEEDYFSYDSFGNPIDYYNGAYYYIDWYNGRELTNIDYSAPGGGYHDIHYTYDADGIRNWKSVDNVEHYYTTQNGKVVREKIGSGSTAKILDFIYDEFGRPFALNYSEDNGANFTPYYYVLNLQGDVVKLVRILASSVGVQEYNVVATYSYDAWGNILLSSGPMADINPLRYRGYYFDLETGFYYLQSRYYDPVLHRFINADSYATSNAANAISCNMFAYGNNNPVHNADPTGHDASTDADGNGIPDYLDQRWRDLTAKIKPITNMMQALKYMGFEECSFASAAQCVRALEIGGITTPEQKAHFFAQCFGETKGKNSLEAEYLIDDGYTREQIDQILRGHSYYPWYGAGYMQITWQDTYEKFSQFVGASKTLTPAEVHDNYAWISAGWFWSYYGINDYVGAYYDDYSDVYMITRRITGDTKVFPERWALYNQYITYWGG